MTAVEDCEYTVTLLRMTLRIGHRDFQPALVKIVTLLRIILRSLGQVNIECCGFVTRCLPLCWFCLFIYLFYLFICRSIRAFSASCVGMFQLSRSWEHCPTPYNSVCPDVRHAWWVFTSATCRTTWTEIQFRYELQQTVQTCNRWNFVHIPVRWVHTIYVYMCPQQSRIESCSDYSNFRDK